MRYAAPTDVSGITLSTGPLVVVDGFVEVPDDALPGDLGGLAVNGFTPVPVDVAQQGTAPTKASKTELVDPAPSDKPTA